MIDLDRALGRTVSEAGTVHDRLRDTLTADTYGVVWCLTDLLLLEDSNARALCLDALGGFQRGKFYAEIRSPVLVTLETVDRKPFELKMSRPSGKPQGWQGIYYHPKQSKWRVVATMPAVFSVPVSSDVEAQSALWLLNKYGWRARERGNERWRYNRIWPLTWERGQRKVAQEPVYEDNWRLVERAYYEMHPEHTPEAWRTGNGKEAKEGQEGQGQVAPPVVAVKSTREDKAARLREYHKAYRERKRAEREARKQTQT